MPFSKIIGTGAYLPEKVLTNYDLEKNLDTSHEWIIERTGIERRHIISENQTVADMGALAAKGALEKANLTPKEIDMIVVATCSNDTIFPSTACFIQQALGIPPCPGFDVQAACSGFVYGLSVVDQFIRTNQVKNALLIGTEAMSRVVDWADRSTCILFGDGAGAVVLTQSDSPGVISTKIKADGSEKELLSLSISDYKIHMSGNQVFRYAVSRLQSISLEILAENQVEPAQIDWFVPHQANIRIIQATAKKLNLSLDKVILTVQEQGNTSAASLPLALHSGIKTGKIQSNQLILFGAFGGGLTWGSALIRV